MKNNLIDIKRVESSPTEPVTLTQIKAQCIVTYSDDDTLLTALGIKARRAVENYCNVSMVAKTITMTADLYNEWELPYGPVTGITSVKTRNSLEGSGPPTYESEASGWKQDGEEFITFIPSGGGSPYETTGPPYFRPYSWFNRYKITYTAGPYTPEDLVHAVLVQTAYLYDHRGEELEDTGVCEQARVLAQPYIRLWL